MKIAKICKCVYLSPYENHIIVIKLCLIIDMNVGEFKFKFYLIQVSVLIC